MSALLCWIDGARTPDGTKPLHPSVALRYTTFSFFLSPLVLKKELMSLMQFCLAFSENTLN
jgi:hypothetical protein